MRYKLKCSRPEISPHFVLQEASADETEFEDNDIDGENEEDVDVTQEEV